MLGSETQEKRTPATVSAEGKKTSREARGELRCRKTLSKLTALGEKVAKNSEGEGNRIRG